MGLANLHLVWQLVNQVLLQARFYRGFGRDLHGAAIALVGKSVDQTGRIVLDLIHFKGDRAAQKSDQGNYGCQAAQALAQNQLAFFIAGFQDNIRKLKGPPRPNSWPANSA